MKKIISLLMILIILSYSCCSAVLIDVNTEVFKDDSLPFSDLQYPALDYRGRPKYDRDTNKQFFKNHRAINEIIKASKLVIRFTKPLRYPQKAFEIIIEIITKSTKIPAAAIKFIFFLLLEINYFYFIFINNSCNSFG